MSAETSPALKDWTKGTEAIVYQVCDGCGSVQYFQRHFCCVCGSRELKAEYASGEGVVYATSLVTRAATPETRAHAPYNIVLIDTLEGFRMMAHGDQNLAIGDKVSATYKNFTDRLIPYFERTKP